MALTTGAACSEGRTLSVMSSRDRLRRDGLLLRAVARGAVREDRPEYAGALECEV
jgi:hypothetical protein